MPLPTPPEPQSSRPFGPVVRKESASVSDEFNFSHQRSDGYRVFISPSGRMEVRPPLADAWKGPVP